jgi:hypothetical protein
MPSDSDGSHTPSNVEQLQAELKSTQEQLAKIRSREARMADLLKCAPERLEHDLRNVLNELQLLRTVFESEEKSRQEKSDAKHS